MKTFYVILGILCLAAVAESTQILEIYRFYRNLALHGYYCDSDVIEQIVDKKLHECVKLCSVDPSCVQVAFKDTPECILYSQTHTNVSLCDVDVDKLYSYYVRDFRDCSDAQKIYPSLASGVYWIYPADGGRGFQTFCDMSTSGGGWTVFQRRQDGSVDFFRDWDDYKNGFGSPDKEFWLGNEFIRRLVVQRPCVLRIDMVDEQGNTGYAEYSSFMIDDEANRYKLSISGFTGNRGDSLIYAHNRPFVTKDRDVNDCAKKYFGGWWYLKCHRSNLNGLYGNTEFGKGLNWKSFTTHYGSLKWTEMKLRPVCQPSCE